MKKVININFQGRVIPIEDSAYDLLQQYIASLRTYFAKEEGRDEIINDIESRICELFGEQLKKGASCIMDEDVTAIMDSMGRPADFEAAEDNDSEEAFTANTKTSPGANPQSGNSQTYGNSYQKRRMYRDEQDKVLGGVASGLAHYFNIDPAITRILFALLAFAAGTGFLLYIVLWVLLPSHSLVTNIRKRLYRDTEDRIFKGVCGGLGKYFDINPLIPRIIFAAPFLFGIITTLGRHFFFETPVLIGGFSSSTFIVTYLILWAILPEAISASEKLEMKGEKVDLNSIRDTIIEDIQGFRGRAEKIKDDVQASASRFAKQTQSAWQTGGRPFVHEASSTIRRTSRGFGSAIGIILRAFIMILGGLIAFLLLIGLLALLSTGIGRLQFTDFLLNGFWQRIFGWGVMLFFIGAPVLGIIISIIRRMMRTNTRNRYLSYTFSTLWLLGLCCLICLIGLMSRDFRYEQPVVSDFQVVQPVSNKLSLQIGSSSIITSDDDWIEWDGAIAIENDSLYLNTIKVNVIRSLDSLYHIHVVKLSKGNNALATQQRSNKIDFNIEQSGSTIYLPENFAIGASDKWRNQRVLIVVEVPVGKIINISSDLSNRYSWFNVSINRFGVTRNNRNSRSIDRRWYDDQTWNSDEDMIQTPKDLQRASRYQEENGSYKYRYNDNENNEKDEDDIERPTPSQIPVDSTRKKDSIYRYPTTRTASLEQSAEPSENSTLRFSPLASFLW